MLDVMPKIDGLSEERVTQMRDALFHADHPYLIVFVGPFSSGKSTLINALLGAPDALPTGITPTTDRISILRHSDQFQRARSGEVDTLFYPSPLLEKVSFVDTPGLESVFKTHEEITRRFLHRSDTVFLVMLATQAMTARNLDYLKMLREYGKNVIILLNQVDLLSPDEVEAVRKYILEQSQDALGFKPQVWAVSGKAGMAARRADGTLDEEAWAASGIDQIERYVDEQLGDVERLRGKLRTPLQIAQSVHQSALDVVRGNQAALDQYQSIGANIDQQLTAYKRDQDKIVRETGEEISAKFGEAALHGSEAIEEMFSLARVPGSLFRGLMELLGLARLARRAGSTTYTRASFEKHKAFEPIRALPGVVDKLAPRLEGRDIQDIDDLVKYARREIEALPPAIRDKVIGSVQAPMSYDRSALQKARPALEAIEDEAKQVETDRLERTVRNSLLYLAAWEVFLLILVIFVAAWNPSTPEMPALALGVVVVLVIVMLVSLLYLPLRGRRLENRFTKRMLALQGRYIETLNKAADEQVEYGMRLRREAVAPLTRLIDAQTRIQTEQLNQLEDAGQAMTKIEGELASMGKPSLLGLRG
jgi:ribosome biogenesis GTPase A